VNRSVVVRVSVCQSGSHPWLPNPPHLDSPVCAWPPSRVGLRTR
jgi:hypothetical protein